MKDFLRSVCRDKTRTEESFRTFHAHRIFAEDSDIHLLPNKSILGAVIVGEIVCRLKNFKILFVIEHGICI